jgi:hypothetical protein
MLKIIFFKNKKISLQTNISCNNKIANFLFRPFSEKIKKEEILLYIMQDKFSIKPDKEFRINHSTIEDESGCVVEDSANISKKELTNNQSLNGKLKKPKVVTYGR